MKKRQIEFLNRIFELLKCRSELLLFLKEERLITADTIHNITSQHHTLHAESVAALLAELAKQDKLQLLYYEWTILPIEHMKLTLITNHSKKEFEFNA